ncbi:MAG: 3-deoxy-D-manno-octulosonic acid transferase [Flavobacteriaceae bacterium]
MLFRTIYNVIIEISFPILWIIGLFSKKINLFTRGRSKTFKILKSKSLDSNKWVWFHVASLGEFEQAKPLIIAYKKHFPKDKILLTFFSPSGYEIKKNFSYADCICYLPWDTIKNVNRFLDFCNVKLAIFVKYEFWPNFFKGLHKRKIPVYSVSSIFRPQQLFFRWYGVGYRKPLYDVKHYFVQNDLSKKLLNNLGINAVSVNGDTRIDRVYQMVKQENKLEIMDDLTSGIKCFVAGSTWPEDHNLIEDLLKKKTPIKIVIVPHEVSRKVIGNLEKKIKLPYAKWSTYDTMKDSKKRILIVDKIGELSKIYSYAAFAYVGGGFKNKKLHNTLEPAAFSIPVIIGPYFKTFQEADALVGLGGIFSIKNKSELKNIFDYLLLNDQIRKKAGMINGKYISKRIGASSKFINKLKELHS